MSDETEQVQKALYESIRSSKCPSCRCFHEAVSTLSSSEVPATLTAALGDAQAVLVGPEYDCLGCDPCWPADALNAMSPLVAIDAVQVCVSAAVAVRDGWPPLPGDYRVVRFAAPVAVCTCHSRSLSEDICQQRPTGLALAGSLETENLGIERLVANISANPHIRRLVLCGADCERQVGHYPGQSLVALVQNGLDQDARIVGARGRRPVLRNIDRSVIEHFRRQVEIVDQRGVADAAVLAEQVTQQAKGSPGPMDCIPDGARSIELAVARQPVDLKLDPSGYVVIYVDRQRQQLVVEHYQNSGLLDLVITGQEGASITTELFERELVTRLDHAAYLGKELAAAEKALRDGTDYRQDRAPGSARDSD